MPQLEHIEAIEKHLWSAADTLRANSNYASNEYFLPVMGLIFLRHAYSRFLAVKGGIEANLPRRGGKARALVKEDFSQKSAIFLRPKARFDALVALTDSDDRAHAIIEAMESIEGDYDNLHGVLPKSEYQELDNTVLGQLLRTLNPDELKKVSGDVFGRIYEYFLTQFADQKAHDGGEFFTPVSLVSLIAHVLDPEKGTVLDPACGSGGMFVQSAHVVETHHENPAEKFTFRGLEKNAVTIRLAKMNLAVHGLEGDIQKAITYYEDPHELLDKADFVMANPPFNVDEIDADKVKNDPRLPFGLPGVNKKGKVSNGNYIWISYFYSYLNEKGRAGFVMSSQASSAGGREAEVRRKLVETGEVDVMIAIRSNFFYTRTVPCELWFFNRNKPAFLKDKILMLDARNVYRRASRKIYDFSPEQLQNLTAIVWLYRGQSERFLALVESYLQAVIQESKDVVTPVTRFIETLTDFLGRLPDVDEEMRKFTEQFKKDEQKFQASITKMETSWNQAARDNENLKACTDVLSSLVEASRDLVKQIDQLSKFTKKLAKESSVRGLNKLMKELGESREEAVEQLKKVRDFHKQAHWLQERFPNAELCNVEGLVKLVDRVEIEASDWSLTPGRYVGVAPEEEDENFDFEEALRDIHIELQGLNDEAEVLAVQIQKNFEELGI